MLLWVLWSFLHFSPGRWRWREGGKQVSRLQDNVLVILSAWMWSGRDPSEGTEVDLGGGWEWGGMGRVELFCFGFPETVSLFGSYCPGLSVLTYHSVRITSVYHHSWQDHSFWTVPAK